MHRSSRWALRSTLVLTAAALSAAVASLPGSADDSNPDPATIRLTKLGTYASGLFAQGGAEISTYDTKSKRLFVVNGASAAPRIDVLQLADPANPALEFSIDVTPYGASANSVAFHGKTLAVAVQAKVKTDPGVVVFFDANGVFVSQVTVGALPDMLTFTPNGKRVLVANEGEPSDDYTVDPEGSVSVIDLRRGAAKVKQSDVTTIGFGGLQLATLDPSIRVFGPNASIAQDFEPEYITVSPDGATAWVTIQENNALAEIDLETLTLRAVRGLGFANHGAVGTSIEIFPFTNLPVLGTTDAGQDILLGGFSGLHFEGIDAATGRLKFLTHPDRGPNANPTDVDGDGTADRPFALPDLQCRWVRFELDRATGDITLTGTTLLTRADGVTPITGISNRLGAAGLAHSDEPPVTPAGDPIVLDPYGADPEGVVRADDGTWWMCDEYRPALYHFDAAGVLIQRFVPQGSNSDGVVRGVEALPAVYAKRRANRGFEAIAYRNGKVYAFIQSPIDDPDLANDGTSKASRVVRIVEFDAAASATTAEYYYVLEGGASDKIGDAVAVGTTDFLVIERDDATGAGAKKKVFRISLAGATKVNTVNPAVYTGGTLEATPLADLTAAGVQPVLKELYVDLIAAGYSAYDKVEGLAFIDADTIAVLNDNDFGLDGTIDVAAGTVGLKASAPIALGILTLSQRGIDASDRDGGIHIRPRGVYGMYQPDAIASYVGCDGEPYTVLANEGDPRDYRGFAEESRVKDLTLDATAFPQRTLLRNDANLGRLTVTKATGDTDRDGDHDALYAFGTRSFSIRDAAGALVWDSGDLLERLTAARFPKDFNSTNDANASFDTRSDNKGPEPEGLAIGRLWDRTFAFVGLERISAIAVFDVTDPKAPVFVEMAANRDFAGNAAAGTAGDLGPEGLLFIPKNKSPNRQPLLVVSNEVSGTTTVWQIERVGK